MTLYEQIKNSEEGLDICDTIYDFGIYYDFNTKDNDTDEYSLCLKEIAKQIEFRCFKPNWYSQCHIAEFMHKNQSIFNKFIKDNYSEEYIPKKEDYNIEDEEFYDIYIDLFEMIVRGSFDDKQYKWLREALEGGIKMKDLNQVLNKITKEIATNYYCDKESINSYIENQVSDLIEVYDWDSIESNIAEENKYRLRVNIDFYDKYEELLQHISFVVDFHQNPIEENIID